MVGKFLNHLDDCLRKGGWWGMPDEMILDGEE